MPTGYTTVSATNLCDATGTVIANATISFKPVDNKGKPLSFRAGGTSLGQAISQPVATTVTNGAFSITLADTTLTTPVNVGYAVTVIDNVSGDCLLSNGYQCVQPSGATWSFDAYVPNFASQVTVQAGPQGIQGIPGTNGTNGINGANGIASLPQLASVRLKLPIGSNLYNAAADTAGFIEGADGTVGSYGTYVYSDLIPANAGGQMVANFSTPGDSAAAAYYDSNNTFISSFQITAGTAFTVPSTAAYLRTSQAAPNAKAMLVNGSTLPSTYKSFGSYSTSETDSLLSVVPGASSAALTRSKLAPVAPVNLFNATSFTTDVYINDASGNGQPQAFTSYGYGVSDYIPANTGGQMVANISLPHFNSQNVVSRYDAGLNYIPYNDQNTPGDGIVAGTPFSITAQTAFIRVSMPNANDSSFMLCNGTSLPANYQGFGVTRPMRSSLFGKKFAVFGDSISESPASQWQYYLSLLTGASLGLNDARGGRQLAQVFECYGGGTGTGTNRFVTLAVDPITHEPAGYQNNGTIGNTLAQDLAGHDLIFLVLGTNEYNGGASSVTVGSPSDSVSTASEYGYVNAALTGLHTAAPHAQIIVVTPWQNAFEFTVLSSGLTMVQTIVQVLITAAGAFGDKVVNMLLNSGHNALTTAGLTQDAGDYSGTPLGVHPNAIGDARWAAIIAHAAEGLF